MQSDSRSSFWLIMQHRSVSSPVLHSMVKTLHHNTPLSLQCCTAILGTCWDVSSNSTRGVMCETAGMLGRIRGAILTMLHSCCEKWINTAWCLLKAGSQNEERESLCKHSNEAPACPSVMLGAPHPRVLYDALALRSHSIRPLYDIACSHAASYRNSARYIA